MKYLLLSIFVFSLFYTFAIAEKINPAFSPRYRSAIMLSINKKYNNTEATIPLNAKANITSLAVNGYATFRADGFIRVILEDMSRNEYLVAELNRMVNGNQDTTYLNNYCEETVRLSNICPVCIKVYAQNAILQIDNIVVSCDTDVNSYAKAVEEDNYKDLQIQQKVTNINLYNEENNLLWLAGNTPLAAATYEQRKSMLGITDNKTNTYGIEYYVAGIFEIGSANKRYIGEQTSNCIPNFDWRNQHGKNWITSQKDQGESSMCVSFALAGTLEAMVNLYFNRILELDLSEVDVALYNLGRSSYEQAYKNGASIGSAVATCVSKGISDEESIPFVDSADYVYPSVRPESLERIFYANYKRFSNSTYVKLSEMDSLKKFLIHYGPLCSGFHYGFNHAMVLTGYRQLQAGDTLYITETTSSHPVCKRVQENDPRIGMTYWLFKNSYGTKYSTENDGYYNVLFTDDNIMLAPFALIPPITSRLYNESDRICNDEDGDGFYFWGNGSKPENCPASVPDEPDGDDSNCLKGPMNEFGYCRDLSPENADTIYIENDTYWNIEQHVYQHIVVRNCTTLKISGNTFFHNGATIFIERNGVLDLDHCILKNASINCENAANVKIRNNAKVELCESNDFIIPLGTSFEVINSTFIY